jgi:hypothetical protein
MDGQVTLRELTDANRDELPALRLAPGQDRFVSSVAAYRSPRGSGAAVM